MERQQVLDGYQDDGADQRLDNENWQTGASPCFRYGTRFYVLFATRDMTHEKFHEALISVHYF